MRSQIASRPWLISVVTSFTLLFSLHAHAQDKQSKALQVDGARIPTVLVSPRDAASLPIPLPKAKTKKKFIAGPAPATLSWSDRTRLLRGSGVSILPETAPRTFRLSVRNPYIAGAGWLEFLKSYQTSPKDDYALFDESSTLDAFLWARLNVERGRYLIDFTVFAFATSTFTVFVGEHRLDIAAREGPQRISVVVESTGTGLTDITLSVPQGYVFRNMEIMRIDEGGR